MMEELKACQLNPERVIEILWGEVAKDQQPLHCTRKELCDAVEMAEESIRRAALENKPLTLEQLRGMDGEPVYMVYAGNTYDGWRLSGDAQDYVYDVQNRGATAYARKPEAGEKG